MTYKLKIWSHSEKEWGWSILDYVGDEVASCDTTFDNEKDCRQEARCAYSDWVGE